ncbi:MAG: hypothetical protein JRI80_19835 [Deltaproteobacteria bacterium]|nr:hypothetical protein [Deltaproteobacteria bacterium]
MSGEISRKGIDNQNAFCLVIPKKVCAIFPMSLRPSCANNPREASNRVAIDIIDTI